MAPRSRSRSRPTGRLRCGRPSWHAAREIVRSRRVHRAAGQDSFRRADEQGPDRQNRPNARPALPRAAAQEHRERIDRSLVRHHARTAARGRAGTLPDLPGQEGWLHQGRAETVGGWCASKPRRSDEARRMMRDSRGSPVAPPGAEFPRQTTPPPYGIPKKKPPISGGFVAVFFFVAAIICRKSGPGARQRSWRRGWGVRW